MPEALRGLIEPVVEEHDCELVDVEVARNRGTGLLRITVDSPAGDGRVPIERCVRISREVETLLDATDAMPGAYNLEVSSPGLDRVLGREKDFVAAVGREVKLRTRRPIEGRKRFRGRLQAVEPEAAGATTGSTATMVRMEVDGEQVSIPFDEIEKANAIYEFTPADFAKQPERREPSAAGREPSAAGKEPSAGTQGSGAGQEENRGRRRGGRRGDGPRGSNRTGRSS